MLNKFCGWVISILGPQAFQASKSQMLEGEWPLEANGYEFFGGIGKGAFSNVCRACRKSDRMPVAIKIMDLENISTSFEDILQVCWAKDIVCHIVM